jgi:hypothetical protein
MKHKQLITIVLIAFAAITAAAIIYQELQSQSNKSVSQDITPPDGTVLPEQCVVYYFYGDQRCATCMKLEAYTEETLKTHFSNELDSKRIVWKTVNIDQPENQHFITDFELDVKTVVVADLRNGELNRWKKLNDTWLLVGNHDSFIDYVQAETQMYLSDEL